MRWRVSNATPLLLGALLAVAVAAAPALGPDARRPPPPEKKEEEKPKTYWEEHKLFAYIENSYTFNLTGAGRGGTNELRFYDNYEGYTFNMAEFSIKKDPDGAVLVGVRARRDRAASTRRRTTRWASSGTRRTPSRSETRRRSTSRRPTLSVGCCRSGNGLILKGGKFVTLLGYEVIESPNNLNFSRGYLFTLRDPAHPYRRACCPYAFTDWFNATAGVVLGWDNSGDNNERAVLHRPVRRRRRSRI